MSFQKDILEVKKFIKALDEKSFEEFNKKVYND